MFKKIFCLILILKLIQARYGFVPKFYGQDSAIIVDTNKSLIQTNNEAAKYPHKIRMPPPFPIWRHYPRYHIIPPPRPGQMLAINTWAKVANTKRVTTTTSTTTTTPKPTIKSTTAAVYKSTISLPLLSDDNEFPKELLDIAKNKLGLKSIEEIPSISELGQLLGTNGPQETLNYVKQLSTNDQGVALMKAYIESADYTDNTADLENKIDRDLLNEKVEGEGENEMGDIEEPINANDEGLIVITDEDSNDDYELNNENEQTTENTFRTTLKPNKIINKFEELPQSHNSFMESIAGYMQFNKLFQKTEDEENKNYNQLNRITENGKKVPYSEEAHHQNHQQESTKESEISTDSKAKENNFLKPSILVRESIPYNYPVPIRAQTTIATSIPSTLATAAIASNSPVVHLNTPKVLIPHVQQLSRVTKIPTKQIEDFLISKPKLLKLANKISRFPINYEANSPIEAQLLAAVKKAFAQDEDLQKLLNSAATLK